MERFSTILLLPLFALVWISGLAKLDCVSSHLNASVVAGGVSKGNDGCRYLAQVPGGCPDIHACAEVCAPCYRGVGSIYVECIAGSGPIYWPQCRCYFKDGAPCPPQGPPTCPKPPQGPLLGFPARRIIINQTAALLY